MKIYIPNSAFLGNLDPFLKRYNPFNPNLLEIKANKSWISIHPFVLSMIAALGLTVEPGKIECEKFEAVSKHYLYRMGLFNFLRVPSGIEIEEHEPAGRFIPLTQIKNSRDLTHFITEMVPLLHVLPKEAESIRYIISELARNVLEHSLSAHGAVVSAQYYKKSNTIRIGIADTGVGIKESMNQSYNTRTDMEAIRLALMPGVTGTTKREGGSELNAGAGLFFVKSIAAVNRNFFVIYSGKAMYKLLKRNSKIQRISLHSDPFKDRHSECENLPHWQGTLVGIDISLNSTKEFSNLLDLIRETYTRAIRERKKAKYRKAKFI